MFWGAFLIHFLDQKILIPNLCMKLIEGLPVSILTQLRMGHAPLNNQLHRIGKAESPACAVCGYYREMPFHYLVQCPAYEIHRMNIKRKLCCRMLELHSLFTSACSIQLLLKFMDASKRFQKSNGELRAAETAHQNGWNMGLKSTSTPAVYLPTWFFPTRFSRVFNSYQVNVLIDSLCACASPFFLISSFSHFCQMER